MKEKIDKRLPPRKIGSISLYCVGDIFLKYKVSRIDDEYIYYDFVKEVKTIAEGAQDEDEKA